MVHSITMVQKEKQWHTFLLSLLCSVQSRIACTIDATSCLDDWFACVWWFWESGTLHLGTFLLARGLLSMHFPTSIPLIFLGGPPRPRQLSGRLWCFGLGLIPLGSPLALHHHYSCIATLIRYVHNNYEYHYRHSSSFCPTTNSQEIVALPFRHLSPRWSTRRRSVRSHRLVYVLLEACRFPMYYLQVFNAVNYVGLLCQAFFSYSSQRRGLWMIGPCTDATGSTASRAHQHISTLNTSSYASSSGKYKEEKTYF